MPAKIAMRSTPETSPMETKMASVRMALMGKRLKETCEKIDCVEGGGEGAIVTFYKIGADKSVPV